MHVILPCFDFANRSLYNFQEIQPSKSPDSTSLVDILYGDNQPLPDSILLDNQKMMEATETFLQKGSAEILQTSVIANQMEWFVYILLFMLAGIAIIWHYIPERLVSVFTFTEKEGAYFSKKRNIPGPGLLIRFFFFLNYLSVLSIFIYEFIKRFFPAIYIQIDDIGLIVKIGFSILVLFLYRNVIGIVSGFIFKTVPFAKKQLDLYLSTDNALGILLIPILIIILFVQNDLVYYIGLIVVVITHIFRWFQTFFIGKSISGYSLLHLFMYLCTLEIIPLLVLIKLLQNGTI